MLLTSNDVKSCESAEISVNPRSKKIPQMIDRSPGFDGRQPFRQIQADDV